MAADTKKIDSIYDKMMRMRNVKYESVELDEKIINLTPDERVILLEKFKPHMLAIATGISNTYFFQKFLKSSDDKIIDSVLEILRPCFSSVCTNKYGNYVAQLFILKRCHDRSFLEGTILPSLAHISSDENGYFVSKKLIEILSGEELDRVVECVQENLFQFLNNQNGCLITSELISKISPQQVDSLLEALLNLPKKIPKNKSLPYVIKDLIKRCTDSKIDQLFNVFTKNVVKLVKKPRTLTTVVLQMMYRVKDETKIVQVLRNLQEIFVECSQNNSLSVLLHILIQKTPKKTVEELFFHDGSYEKYFEPILNSKHSYYICKAIVKGCSDETKLKICQKVCARPDFIEYCKSEEGDFLCCFLAKEKGAADMFFNRIEVDFIDLMKHERANRFLKEVVTRLNSENMEKMWKQVERIFLNLCNHNVAHFCLQKIVISLPDEKVRKVFKEMEPSLLQYIQMQNYARVLSAVFYRMDKQTIQQTFHIFYDNFDALSRNPHTKLVWERAIEKFDPEQRTELTKFVQLKMKRFSISSNESLVLKSLIKNGSEDDVKVLHSRLKPILSEICVNGIGSDVILSLMKRTKERNKILKDLLPLLVKMANNIKSTKDVEELIELLNADGRLMVFKKLFSSFKQLVENPNGRKVMKFSYDSISKS